MPRKRKASEMEIASSSSSKLVDGGRATTSTTMPAETQNVPSELANKTEEKTSVFAEAANIIEEKASMSAETGNLDREKEIEIAAVDTQYRPISHSVPQRRSARIQTISSKQELALLEQRHHGEKITSDMMLPKLQKKIGKEESIDLCKKSMECEPTEEKEEEAEDDEEEGASVEIRKAEKTRRAPSKVKEIAASHVVLSDDFSVAHTDDHEAGKKVKDALRLFNTYYLRFVQEEEVRCRKEDAKENTAVKKKSKKKEESDEPRKSRRPDLKAISQMKADGKLLCNLKTLGHVPGIHVGDHFFSRCEMIAVGLHYHWLAGIDFIGAAYKKIMAKWKLPVASSIILSGLYEDDIDNANEVVYTGQGGQDLLGSKRQIADQIMDKGNLALKNNMEQDLPVRLIRGHKTKKSYTGKVYTYDGLYKVKKFWAEKGISGFTVFKFSLHRMEGQPMLTTEQVHFISGQVPSNPSELKGLVCADISNGLEEIPVPASNVVDPIPSRPELRYLAVNEVSKEVPAAVPSKGCSCKGECYDVTKCSCAKLNGKKFPYVSRNGGRLVEPMDVVYECGPHCGCGPSCSNRVTQRGMYYRLEVFKTANKGWAVRSWDTIPAGAPVCEYTGVLMRTADADNIGDNEYLFELDCLQTIKGVGGRQRRDLSKSNEGDALNDEYRDVPEQPEYCIDAGSCGSVARYINHSCEPNLFVQCVLNDHHDLSRPHIWFCAADTIHPLEELSYDYGYELDSVVKDGKVKVLPCYCGAPACKKRLH